MRLARNIGPAPADDVVKAVLAARYSPEDGQERRMCKVKALERRGSKEQP
ncbi:MAG TPA: hypothetical protein VFD38_10390 [Myxococcaceae bacterium]|nr:hypothetical protein [Myxococcaceae bacterium]